MSLDVQLHPAPCFDTPHFTPLQQPANLVILTSARDIQGDDQVGRTLRLNNHDVYMMGFTEALVRLINGEHDRISQWMEEVEMVHGDLLGQEKLTALTHRIFELGEEIRSRIRTVGVIFDDTPHDTKKADFSLSPHENWIFPADLRDNRGELFSGQVAHIPSSYRALPLREKERRAQGKSDFEDRVYATAVREMGADIVLSDHLMVILSNLLTRHHMGGALLNLHPAITDRYDPDCFRGDSPTKMAIEKARLIDPTTGEPFQVRTGATFHFIDEGIDTGPCIARGKLTPVHPNDTPQLLRHRNYPAKILIGLEGLLHYVTERQRLTSLMKPSL